MYHSYKKTHTKWSNYITCLEKHKNMFCCLYCINASEAGNDLSGTLLPQATRLRGYILHLGERERTSSDHFCSGKAAPPLFPGTCPTWAGLNLYKWCNSRFIKCIKFSCRNNLYLSWFKKRGGGVLKKSLLIYKLKKILLKILLLLLLWLLLIFIQLKK